MFKLFEIPLKERRGLPKGFIAEAIDQKGSGNRCVVVSQEKVELPYKKVPFPEFSLSQLREKQQEDQKTIDRYEGKLKKGKRYLEVFTQELEKCKFDLRYEKVVHGMQGHEALVLLKGFCPLDACEELQACAEKENWALLVEEPDDSDQVPTFIRNPKWIEMIKPVFQLIDIVPGYKEMDISLFFLLFFSLFFGMLIGDAAYGVLFFMATAVCHLKFGKRVEQKGIFFLMYVLSSATIIWGILAGTYFGQEWSEGLVGPVIPWLRDSKKVQELCFFIGAFHMSIAHLWRGILKMPALKALSELGWIILLWVMFFAAKTFVLGEAFPSFAVGLLWGGIFLVAFFTKPNKNPLKALGAGAGDLALNFVNTFADTVSYIRLFAVGLATVAIADAFNGMATGIGFNSVVAGLLAGIILVVGHFFNIILGAMSILVHGLRLNVLEFSGHLNMEWAGFKYNPFKKK